MEDPPAEGDILACKPLDPEVTRPQVSQMMNRPDIGARQ